MNTCLRGGSVVLPDRVLPDHSVWIAEGRIVMVTPDDQPVSCAGVEVVDVSGSYVGPGFFDIHCHGGDGAWVFEDPVAASEYHLGHGTTSMLATTLLLETHPANVAAVATISAAVRGGETRTIRGIHMEGPYLSPDFGAYKEFSVLPEPSQYADFVTAADGLLRTMTIAPELSGVTKMVHDLQAATAGTMTFSVGHSRATRAQIQDLLPAGLRLATHLTNASGHTPEVTRYGGTREVGVDEAVLLDDGIWAEVIADGQGAHVRPDMLRLIVKTKGIDRVITVTDCSAAEGEPPVELAGQAQDIRFNGSGGLAGSALTMDAAVGNLARHGGLSLVDAWRTGSYNPAAALGLLGQVGQLAPGRVADLVVANHRPLGPLQVQQVWLGGVQVAGGALR